MAARSFYDNTGDISQSNPGTGDFILQGTAPTALIAALRIGKTTIANNASVEYLAVDTADKTKWEIGFGTYTTAANHLTRTVTRSSNSDAAVNFTGTCNIYFGVNIDSIAAAVLTTTGDILYHDGTVLARLAIGASTTVLHGGTTPSYSQIVNADITAATINLTTKVTGVLPVANGGTNGATASAARTNLSAAQSDPLGLMTMNAYRPIPYGIVDWASNGTNYVFVGTQGVWTTTDPTDATKWVGNEGTPFNFISVCRVSGVGYVGITTSRVFINANEDGKSWVLQTFVFPFTLACIRTDGTTMVICGTSAAYLGTTAGHIWTSTDAVTWTQQTSNAGANNLNWMDYNSTFAAMVAVGAGGKVITAPASFTTWTSRTSNTTNALQRVTITPDGLHAVAVGVSGTIISTTTPSTAWTVQTSAANVTLTGVASNNTTYIASAGSTTASWYSSNLTAWARNGNGNTGGQVTGIIYANSKYVVAGAQGIQNGSAITSLTPVYDQGSTRTWTSSLAYRASNTKTIVGQTAGGILASVDGGATWATETSGLGAVQLNGAVYDLANDKFSMVGAGGNWIGSGGTGTWTPITSGSSNTLNAICTDQSVTNKQLVVGVSGTIITSANGLTATVQTSNVTDDLNCCASNGSGTYIAAGAPSRIGSSTDGGVTWTWQNPETNGINSPSLSFSSMIWDGTRFVLTDGTSIFSSTAGTSWTYESACPQTNSGTTVIYYGNSEYSLLNPTSGVIWTSTDRKSWAVKWNWNVSTGNRFVGYINSKWFEFGTTGYSYSTDALTWKPYIISGFLAAASYAGHLVLSNGSNSLLFTSTDGSTYTPVASQIAGSVTALATDNTNFVALTSAGLYRSTDNGTTWSLVQSAPITGTFGTGCLAYGNSRFIAGGTNGINYYSTDGGATWTAGPRVAHSFSGIIYDGTLNLFVGLCSGGITVDGTLGSAWTVRENLLAMGAALASSTGGARIAADGNGNVTVADGTAGTETWFQSTDGQTFKNGSGPSGSTNLNTGTVVSYANGLLFQLSSTTSNLAALSYSSDRSIWYYRGLPFGSSTHAPTVITYFNGKYIIGGNSNNQNVLITLN